MQKDSAHLDKPAETATDPSAKDLATFTYRIKASTGYEAEATHKNVTPNQYRQVVAALNGTLKEQVTTPILPKPFFYYRANEDGSIEWEEDCVCADPIFDNTGDVEVPYHSGRVYSEAQVLALLAQSGIKI